VRVVQSGQCGLVPEVGAVGSFNVEELTGFQRSCELLEQGWAFMCSWLLEEDCVESWRYLSSCGGKHSLAGATH